MPLTPFAPPTYLLTADQSLPCCTCAASFLTHLALCPQAADCLIPHHHPSNAYIVAFFAVNQTHTALSPFLPHSRSTVALRLLPICTQSLLCLQAAAYLPDHHHLLDRLHPGQAQGGNGVWLVWARADVRRTLPAMISSRISTQHRFAASFC